MFKGLMWKLRRWLRIPLTEDEKVRQFLSYLDQKLVARNRVMGLSEAHRGVGHSGKTATEISLESLVKEHAK